MFLIGVLVLRIGVFVFINRLQYIFDAEKIVVMDLRMSVNIVLCCVGNSWIVYIVCNQIWLCLLRLSK